MVWKCIVQAAFRTLRHLGGIVGVRETESEVTVTVEAQWSARLDPVRVTLVTLIVGLVVLMGFCAACGGYFDDHPDPVTQGPYHIATPQGPR